MKSVTKIALLSAAIVSAPLAMAHEAGDMFVRGGLINVMPSATDNTGAGLNLDVDDNLQIGLTATYMYTDNIGMELLAATPFTHDITAGGTKVGETSHLPPSLMVQYYFGQANSDVRPYVGAGLNYTVFFDEKLSTDLDANGQTDKLSLDDSFGLAAQVGVDFNITDNLFINASVWYMDINTDVNIDGILSNAELEIDPVSVMASVGYTF
ncbi:Outer membrane protein W precursor [Marinomonas aquimarina]|uniref:Outer membrane protein W n=1 Tax=Marinomonas aquimarina TaxID=295068 RepID=A0A1A8T5S4_9GAMM|nr:OmpW family outer membrane protein [Marinomonas aquimarina]SBS26953.1 Outer membrane protein W precursor [Marinomonas aquimarina]